MYISLSFLYTCGTLEAYINMPGTYTIWTDPSVTPVQHAQQKVPIEYQEQIECTLNDMVVKGVIVPVSSQPSGYHC